MNVNKHLLWCEKYRPKTIDQYVFHDKQQENAVRQMIADQSIPQLLLAGIQGSGKTTLAQILIRAMELDPSDVITINASDERGIDTFRNTIKNFSLSIAMGRFKIVHLEEADQLTPQAQAALKRFMEETSEYVRFILTCNHVNKIIAPIRSRCQEFHFKASNPDDITVYAVEILAAESVKFDLDTVDTNVALGYPDVRKIVNMLQQNTVNGQLVRPVTATESGDYRLQLLDMINADDWNGARKLLCATVTNDEWESVYRFLYENIHRSPKFSSSQKWEEAIVLISEHLYKHSLVADPEICMASCLILLSRI